jgi:hypothetical protein
MYLRIAESVQGNLVQFGSMFYKGYYAYYQNFYSDDNVSQYTYQSAQISLSTNGECPTCYVGTIS